MTLQSIFADLHIHIGRTKNNLPVKITAARNMTFDQIIRESYHRKGLQMIGIIDAHSPPVQYEILEGLQSGLFREHPDGGIVYQHTTCILGTEIEIKEPGMGACHVLVFLPTLSHMISFTEWLAKYMKNVQLSTQRLYRPVSALQEKVMELEGLIIPAHVFTPFKSVYGSATDRLSQLFDTDCVAGVELGLSSDSDLADCLSELHSFTFVTNSDAHSIPKIGREYNELWVKEASFQELMRALMRQDGRKVVANYGLNPRLGKYYRTRCLKCEELWPIDPEVTRCPYCGSEKQVKGVRDRIMELADQEMSHPDHRPPYIHQVPLEYIPKLGKKMLEKLLEAFGTEMNILHHASLEDIAKVANEQIAYHIGLAREQRLEFEEGGGGTYGKVKQAKNT
ncbi:TIGR00375 family protein [Thermoflavimicrobium dichotomicum]|uniref:TIGR00375 family protein n=2 Tax=Thermoflavimicrobium dichotomicum TaxID=46223 RepID=A0A1I3Q6B0_9BACL|nr:TIGR00375 family protein [Thermoflavimicrobium dichotomicum]